jgi:hypothetical protein
VTHLLPGPPWHECVGLDESNELEDSVGGMALIGLAWLD